MDLRRTQKHGSSQNTPTSTKMRRESPSTTLQTCPLFTPTKTDNEDMSANSCLSPCVLFGPVKPAFSSIADLSIGNKPNISIIGRVTCLTEVRIWQNGTGSGKSFSFDLQDSSGEISATVFNSKVDDVLDRIRINKVIGISGFRVKNVNENFRRIFGQDLELVLDNQSTLNESSESCPEITFNFYDILAISKLSPGTITDFIGVIYQAEDVISGTSKDGKSFAYRVLHITDRSKYSFSVKIWGQRAVDFVLDEPIAVILHKAKVEEYDDKKSLSVAFNNSFWLNPDTDDAKDMMLWFSDTRVC